MFLLAIVCVCKDAGCSLNVCPVEPTNIVFGLLELFVVILVFTLLLIVFAFATVRRFAAGTI